MFQNLQLTRPLAFLDIESSGTNPQTDRIVEIAVLRVDPDGKTVEASRRINPGISIPAAATAVHGITQADVADAQAFTAVAPRLVRFLDGCDLAGFGIKRFDIPMLAAECRRAGVCFPLAGRSVIDAMDIFHRKERRDLSAAAAFYIGEEHANAHSAVADVRMSVLVLDAQLARYSDLPRTPDQLHHCLTGADIAGWFRLDDGRPVFARGKHAGHSLAEIVECHPEYIRWLLSIDLLDDARHLVIAASIVTQAAN